MGVISTPEFLADLRTHITKHETLVRENFMPLSDDQLAWQPAPNEWSILQCIEHLNLTHVYYTERLEESLAAPVPADPANDMYKASFWGGIYMFFSFNPKYSFPTADEITPTDTPTRAALDDYLMRQKALLGFLQSAAGVDLIKTPLRIERGVHFNLGDAFKIMVYHDELHLGQALRVLAEHAG